eukprot:m.105409 g.105409  ORF g.105409 m.105409 type:complete len:190 (-) comp15113_c0_seq2:269-838(-)
MVLCICAVDARPSTSHADIYRIFFALDKKLTKDTDAKAQQQAVYDHVVQRVLDDSKLQRDVERGSVPPINADPDVVAQSANTLIGGLRLEPGDVCDHAKLLVWAQRGSLIVFMLAEESENLLLVRQRTEQFLQHLLSLSKSAKSNAVKLLEKLPMIDAYVKTIAPSGRLLFANSRVQAQLLSAIDVGKK